MPIDFLPNQPDQDQETPVVLTSDLAQAMNRWRMSQRPVPTLNEAIMQLLRLGLMASDVEPPRNQLMDDLAVQMRAALEVARARTR